MTNAPKGKGLTATFLLLFIVIIAVVLWLTDPLKEQRAFGLLMSAELVAFSMLVYLYYKKDLVQFRTSWFSSGFVALGLLVILAGFAFSGFGIFSQKIVPLSVSISPASVIIGVTEPQQFNASVTGGVSPYSYQWYVNNASVSSATSSTFTFNFSSASSNEVYVNVTDITGMTAESNIASATVVVINVNIVLYAGEVNATAYGFGNSSSSITSPGPSLTFKVNDVVNMTLHNVGTMGHNWALVTQKVDGSTSLAFPNAQIASGSSPVQPGDTASTIFVVTQAGNYYYICQVDAHVTLGMWGNVTVTS
ncbi:MAG TPA: cupredoxin domain-containing protein [Candidatus Bathyarchaeia archaeon]|nr:cupredoxin domain-containing protein [Candidatus Bathyarchaeia archaeon]